MNIRGKNKKNQVVTANVCEKQELLKKRGDQEQSHSIDLA